MCLCARKTTRGTAKVQLSPEGVNWALPKRWASRKIFDVQWRRENVDRACIWRDHGSEATLIKVSIQKELVCVHNTALDPQWFINQYTAIVQPQNFIS